MANILNFESNEELNDENNMLSSDLTFSQKCIQLLEKYRKCLMDFRNRCICEQNIESETDFNQLEVDLKCILEKQTRNLQKDPNFANIKTENIGDNYENNQTSDESNDNDFNANQDLSEDWVNDNSVDSQGSDEEFIATKKAKTKRLKTEVKTNRSEDISDDWLNNSSDNRDLSDQEFNQKTYKTTNKRLKTESNGHKRKKYVYYNFVCDWIGCERKYSKKDDLMAHISSCHTKEKPFKCEICLKCFAIEKFLKNHEKNHSDISPKKCDTELIQNKSFVCYLNNCGKVFNSTGNLKKHQTTTHSDERPYVCEWPGCSAAYKIKESLINHRAIHSDERQFKCDIEGCLKTFQTKWNYYSHMKAHRSQADPEKARKYPCDWPGCAFNGKSKQDLTIHMNRHMNIKPYKCPAVGCQMSYFTSYELKQHKIKVHEVVNESEREFKCHIDGCLKRYAVERDLKRHLRRHDRIYVCSWPECGQRYAAKQLLSDHMDRHMNVKSFHCHFIGCAKSFFSKTNYESHMKRIHKYNCNQNNKK